MKFTRVIMAVGLVAGVLCGLGAMVARANEEDGCGHAHLAAPDSSFDAVRGRDVRRFPPDPQVQFKHIKLDLRMEKPESKSFTCTETITFKALGRPIKWLELDAV